MVMKYSTSFGVIGQPMLPSGPSDEINGCPSESRITIQGMPPDCDVHKRSNKAWPFGILGVDFQNDVAIDEQRMMLLEELFEYAAPRSRSRFEVNQYVLLFGSGRRQRRAEAFVRRPAWGPLPTRSPRLQPGERAKWTRCRRSKGRGDFASLADNSQPITTAAKARE